MRAYMLTLNEYMSYMFLIFILYDQDTYYTNVLLCIMHLKSQVTFRRSCLTEA